MQQHDIAPHVATLTRALGSKIGTEVSEEEVKAEFAKYLEYGVPVEQAIRTILRHHGVQSTPARPGAAAPAGPVTQERLPLVQVPANTPFVNLRVRLLSLNTKEVNARGEAKTILWGLLGDESGTLPYTSWRPLEGLEKGDVVDVQGAYTKEYNGQAQVNFGDRTKFAKRDAADLAPTPPSFKDVAIAEVREGLRGLRLHGRVLDVQSRTVTVQGQPKTIWGGHLADATGSIEFTAWHDFGLKAGDAVQLEGGYVRAFRGIPQLNFDDGARVTPYAGDLPSATQLASHSPLPMWKVAERGAANDVAVVATLLEVKPGSGLVLRCSQQGCSRVLTAGACRLHNKVDGVPDLRLKGVLDDGTGPLSVVAGRELTEALLGKTLDKCSEEARAAFRPEVIQDQLKERLTGRVFAVRGNVLADDYGLMLVARSFAAHREDTAAEAQALLSKLGVA